MIGLPEKGGTVFLMDIRGIKRIQLHLKIKRKQLLLVHMGSLLSNECLSCEMHLTHFRDV